MQIIIKGKQMEVTPRLRQYIERKVQTSGPPCRCGGSRRSDGCGGTRRAAHAIAIPCSSRLPVPPILCVVRSARSMQTWLLTWCWIKLLLSLVARKIVKPPPYGTARRR